MRLASRYSRRPSGVCMFSLWLHDSRKRSNSTQLESIKLACSNDSRTSPGVMPNVMLLLLLLLLHRQLN